MLKDTRFWYGVLLIVCGTVLLCVAIATDTPIEEVWGVVKQHLPQLLLLGS